MKKILFFYLKLNVYLLFVVVEKKFQNKKSKQKHCS